MKSIHRGFLMIWLIWLSTAAYAQFQFGLGTTEPASPQQVLEVTNYWSQNGVRPGGQIVLGLVLDIRKPYHINANKTKDNYVATTIELLEAPPEVQSTTPIYPEPREILFGVGKDREKLQVF